MLPSSCPSALRRWAGTSLVTLVAAAFSLAEVPTFTDATVHDPSVVRDGSHFYVFGSHLASARTADWMHWEQLSTEPVPGNPLFPNPQLQFAEQLAWVGASNAAFWAPDAIKLADGRYYYYYCIGRLDAPRAVLGVAVSDGIEGPYTDLGVILRSGMWGQPSEDGRIYDPTIHPNAVDPHVFFDHVGRLWMVYGSYSGGIFILAMDPGTGRPLPGQGYGRKLIGGNHSRIEGAYILYSPESEYYYLFISFGGLAADGGYNIRVARSRTPDGPYFDAAGTEMTHVSARRDVPLFDDVPIAPHGVKLMGNFQFLPVPGEPAATTSGYVSPGHNSAYYDPLTGKHFLVFHTRFVGRGEIHEVRVHQLYMNADEWLVAAPHRYAGESLQRYGKHNIPGDYKIINHGKDITATVKTSTVVSLLPNGRVTGAASGTWKLSNDNDLTLSLGAITYRGIVSTQWDDDHGAWVHAFSALSADGTALWGSKVVRGREAPEIVALPDRLALFGETFSLALPLPRNNPHDTYTYTIVSGPTGLTVDRITGVLNWQPTLTQVGVPYHVTVLGLETSADHPRFTHFKFTLTARSTHVVNRVDLDFGSPGAGGLTDKFGQPTGLNARLAGTGSAVSPQDQYLHLDTANGVLALTTTQADFHGQAGLASTSAPGVSLASLGFTGAEDFAATVVFRPLTTLQFIDQVGLYVGAHSTQLTRAGTIVFGTPERYSAHTIGNFDSGARFFGFGLDAADGMTVTISRANGVWSYTIDGLDWTPPAPPTHLNGRADLVAGVFAITPLNNTAKTVDIDAYSLVVATNVPQLTAVEAWRIKHFAQLEATGHAADSADPDGDGRTNLEEFEEGTHPLDPAS